MGDDVASSIQDFMANLTAILPKVLIAIFILLLGYLLGRIVQRLVKRFILYLNETLNVNLQNRLLKVDLRGAAVFISQTCFWIILLISLLFCFQVLNLDFLGYWFDKIVSFLPNVLVAVIIVFVGIISGRLLGDLVKSAAARTGMANGIYLGRIVRYLILFIAIVVAINQLGVDIDFLTNLFLIILSALLFGASLAFGLGAKTSVSNILGSYYARRSHQIGTRILFKDQEGQIVKMTDSNIYLETKSGLLIIPAKDFNETVVTIVKNIK